MGDFAIHLSQINDAVKAAIPNAALKAMEHLKEVSVSKAPIETGNLRESAEVKPHNDGAEVYYPGPYARRQHFELSWKHDHGGQALYLEQPVVQETPRILEICAEELRKAIEE